jgi:hypothetical protein
MLMCITQINKIKIKIKIQGSTIVQSQNWQATHLVRMRYHSIVSNYKNTSKLRFCIPCPQRWCYFRFEGNS